MRHLLLSLFLMGWVEMIVAQHDCQEILNDGENQFKKKAYETAPNTLELMEACDIGEKLLHGLSNLRYNN